jgi:hypothetical protein
MFPPVSSAGTNAVHPMVPSIDISRSPSASVVFANLAARAGSHFGRAATSMIPVFISVTRPVGTPEVTHTGFRMPYVIACPGWASSSALSQLHPLDIRRAGVRRRLAGALGMSANEIQGVKTAALLHDIGKLAVPEHILSKPDPLTQEEFQKIRIHPEVAAESSLSASGKLTSSRTPASISHPEGSTAVADPRASVRFWRAERGQFS